MSGIMLNKVVSFGRLFSQNLLFIATKLEEGFLRESTVGLVKIRGKMQ